MSPEESMRGVGLKQRPIHLQIPNVGIDCRKDREKEPPIKDLIISSFPDVRQDKGDKGRCVFNRVQEFRPEEVSAFIVALSDALDDTVAVGDCSHKKNYLNPGRRTAVVIADLDVLWKVDFAVVADCIAEIFERSDQRDQLVSHPDNGKSYTQNRRENRL